jgi:hypothetical protein
MKVYLAGKISGLKYVDVFLKFSAAEFQLKRAGYDVINPLRLVSQSWGWKKCMVRCIEELMQCDLIYLLPDWSESRGAKLEYHIAQELNIIPLELKEKKI